MARTAVIAGTATATVRAVDGAGRGRQAAAQQQAAQQQQMAELQANQEYLAQQQAAIAQQQAGEQDVSNDLDAQLIQIQKLAALKDQGLLTEEEFQAKKRQILGI
jgi:hypothetical protein